MLKIILFQIPEFTNYPTWIIDPIDGTMNFVHGNPLTWFEQFNKIILLM